MNMPKGYYSISKKNAGCLLLALAWIFFPVGAIGIVITAQDLSNIESIVKCVVFSLLTIIGISLLIFATSKRNKTKADFSGIGFQQGTYVSLSGSCLKIGNKLSDFTVVDKNAYSMSQIVLRMKAKIEMTEDGCIWSTIEKIELLDVGDSKQCQVEYSAGQIYDGETIATAGLALSSSLPKMVTYLGNFHREFREPDSKEMLLKLRFDLPSGITNRSNTFTGAVMFGLVGAGVGMLMDKIGDKVSLGGKERKLEQYVSELKRICDKRSIRVE